MSRAVEGVLLKRVGQLECRESLVPFADRVQSFSARGTEQLPLRRQQAWRREGSLLAIIDRSMTPMGGRLLREWLLAPLREVPGIRYRQLGVAELVDGPFLREEIRAQLADVLDIERLVAKVSTGRANGRDLVALASSLSVVRPLYDKLENVYSKLLGDLREALDPLDDLVARVQGTLVDSPPTTLKEGELVREGVAATPSSITELHLSELIHTDETSRATARLVSLVRAVKDPNALRLVDVSGQRGRDVHIDMKEVISAACEVMRHSIAVIQRGRVAGASVEAAQRARQLFLCGLEANRAGHVLRAW